MLWRSCLLIAGVLLACGEDTPKQGVDAPAGTGSDAPASTIDGVADPDGPPSTIDAAIAAGPACGATTCANGSEDCCIATMGSVCKPAGSCPSQGFGCDGPEDCAGGNCCYGNGGGGSECRTTSCQQLACHADLECPSGTPRCCPKLFTPNYSVCQAQC
jgi:hypothetical protein